MERLLKPQEVADQFGVHYQTVRNMARRGDLEFIRVGEQLRFEQHVIDEYIERRRNEQANTKSRVAV